MSTQLLVNVLRVPSVGTLAPGASVTLPHGLKVADAGVIPTLIEPGGATNIVVTTADSTNVTFRNDDANAGFSFFRIYFDHSIIAEAPVTPLYWDGITGSTSPSGPAGGDLSGTYPDPTVAKLQGNPITAGTPLAGSDLEWDGASWAPTFRYNSTITQLYVNNATGNDSNDGLTALTPKKTIQAAVNVTGMFLATSSSTLVPHVTINIAAQTTTENVDFNGVYSGFGPNGGIIGVALQGAAPTILSGPHTVTAVSNADPDCPVASPVAGGACTVTVGAAAWTPSAFRGKFARLTSGATTSYAPIIDNSATVLTIVRTTAGAVGFSVGNIIEIVEPSTRIDGTISLRGANIGIAIDDIAVTPSTNISPVTNLGGTRPSLTVASIMRIRRCQITATATTGGISGMSGMQFENCVVQGFAGNASVLSGSAGSTVNIDRSFFYDFGFLFVRDSARYTVRGAVFDNFVAPSLNELASVTALSNVTFKRMASTVSCSGLNGTKGGSTWTRVLFHSAATTTVLLQIRTGIIWSMGDVVFVNGATGLAVTEGSSISGLTAPTFSGSVVGMQVSNKSAVTFPNIVFASGVGTGILCDSGSAVTLVGAAATTFSGTLNPVILREGSLLTTRAAVTGTGNAANPLFKINDGSRLAYTTVPAVTGGSSDFSFDGTTKAYADLPYFNTLLSGAAVRSA